MSSDAITVISIVGDNSVARWNELCGPEDPIEAQKSAPNSLRATFGTDLIQNAVHASADLNKANRELEFFFGANAKRFAQSAVMDNCSLCIVKPHAVSQGLVGKI